MLFHPKEPMRILGFTIQGIFPKRQQQFAQKLGTLVGEELLNIRDLKAKINDPSNLKDIAPFIDKHIDDFLQNKLKEKLPVISMFVGEGTLGKIKEGLMEEIEILLPNVIQQFTDKLGENLDVEKIVREKVAGFSSDKLEQILQGIMQKEFRFVEIIGGVLGFIIGLLQILLTQLA